MCSVTNGVVTFEARELKSRKSGWSNRADLTMEQFLADAAREVGCDYAG